MFLFSISAQQNLYKKLLKKNKLKAGQVKLKRFLSGDLYVKIKTVISGQKCLILGGTQNGQLLETLFLTHTLKKEGGRPIIVIIPYLAYARQDKDIRGESLGAELIGQLLKSAGASQVVSVDVHSQEDQKLFPIPLISLNPYGLFAEKIQKEKLKNPVLVAPDYGAIDNARLLQKAIRQKISIIHFHKIRRGETSKLIKKHGRAAGDLIVVDDILDTGGTIIQALKELKKLKAQRIIVVVTHGLFSGNKWRKLWALGVEKIYCTDSLPKTINIKLDKIKIIGIEKIISNYLQKIV